jgi:hypothetical protein
MIKFLVGEQAAASAGRDALTASSEQPKQTIARERLRFGHGMGSISRIGVGFPAQTELRPTAPRPTAPRATGRAGASVPGGDRGRLQRA